IDDVAPVLRNLAVTPATEGGTAVVSGDIFDPGLYDTFTVTAHWGDGSADDSFHFPAGTGSLNIPHRFLNHGTFPASFTVFDNHATSPMSGLSIVIAPVGPLDAFGLGLGSVTEFSTLTSNSGPSDMTIGPDGNLWFTEATANQIGRITRGGVLTEFPVP